MTMEKRPFGQNKFAVTPIGLGLAALGRPGYINLGHGRDLPAGHDPADMEAQAHAVLDAAWAAGIRYFDAARSYGQAEAFLSSWLRQREIPATAVSIGSKWGYTYTANWQVALPDGQKHEVKEHSRPVLQRQIKESKGLLGNHLKLYQIHSATLDSGVLDNQPVLAELARLQETGLAIGLSVSGPNQAETIWRALDIAPNGRPLFSSIQATWNLLETTATTALQAVHDAGWGVIIKEALANGRLTPRNDDPALQDLLTLAADQQTTVDALALAAVLHQPFVAVVLSGAARIDHLYSNLQALTLSWHDELAQATQDLAEPAAVYWQKRSQLAWN